MKIVLFHTEEYFVKIFMDFIARKRPDIDLVGFTSEYSAQESLKGNKASILLCEEGYLKEYIGGLSYIILGAVTSMPQEDRMGKLNIYQRASNILEDFERIVNLCAGIPQEGGGSGRQVVVCSTEGGSGKTTIAYLMAVQGAKQAKTVYWNLELLPVTEHLYHQEFKNTMEEIMFQRQSGGDIKSILYNMLCVNEDGVYVLPAIQSYGNYREMDAALVQELCRQMYNIGMEQIILDLPGGLNCFSDELFLACNHIVWVFSDTSYGRKKEGNIKQDPSLARILAKSSFVRNFCPDRNSLAGATAAFPRSSTLGTATMISTVLKVNSEFVSGCKAILQAIDSEVF